MPRQYQGLQTAGARAVPLVIVDGVDVLRDGQIGVRRGRAMEIRVSTTAARPVAADGTNASFLGVLAHDTPNGERGAIIAEIGIHEVWVESVLAAGQGLKPSPTGGGGWVVSELGQTDRTYATLMEPSTVAGQLRPALVLAAQSLPGTAVA